MSEPDLLSLFAAPLQKAGLSYMITGAAASTLYGQPRTTNDLDVVVDLKESEFPTLREVFPTPQYYLPPNEVLGIEIRRAQRGHIIVLHYDSGFKADLYPLGVDPLHKWALPRRRVVEHGGQSFSFVPPEYLILRKLEFFREGGSSKHLADIRAMLATSGNNIDQSALDGWIARGGLHSEWSRVQ